VAEAEAHDREIFGKVGLTLRARSCREQRGERGTRLASLFYRKQLTAVPTMVRDWHDTGLLARKLN
jgi:hypothetical protein